MMKLFFSIKWFFIFVSVFVFSGCGSISNTVRETKYELVKPTPDLIEKCTISKPPEKKTYLSSSTSDRELVMGQYSIMLINDLNKCNKQWDILQQWFIDQEKVLAKPLKE